MSDEVFKQDIDDKSVLEPGGPYIIQMLFKKPVEMPDKDEIIHIMKKHVGPIESFCYDEKMAGFAALDHIAEYQDGKCPVQLMIMGCNTFDGECFIKYHTVRF